MLFSPRFVTMQWLCSQLCYLTAANQRTIVEIELLATVGWKWGCQPFSCPCSQNVTHCPKEICSTSLSKESIPAIHFVNSKHPLPTRKGEMKKNVRRIQATHYVSLFSFVKNYYGYIEPFIHSTCLNDLSVTYDLRKFRLLSSRYNNHIAEYSKSRVKQ